MKRLSMLVFLLSSLLVYGQSNGSYSRYPGATVDKFGTKNDDGSTSLTVVATSHSTGNQVTITERIEKGKDVRKETGAATDAAYDALTKTDESVMAFPDGEGDDKGGGKMSPILDITIGERRPDTEPKKLPTGSISLFYKNYTQFEQNFQKDLTLKGFKVRK